MPHQIYKTKDGKRVPSVTTITKLYGDSGGLLYWANQQGLDGNTLEDARQATATPGSMIHERVDYHIRNEAWVPETWEPKFSTPELYRDAKAKVARGFDNFLRWESMTQMKLIAGEIALVSEEHRYGGCLDAIMTRDGVALADWKTGTSGSIYADFLYQVAGYGILWNENFLDKPITAGYHIIRFNRDYADFSHWHFAELDDARRGFLLLREMYEINKRVKKRVS